MRLILVFLLFISQARLYASEEFTKHPKWQSYVNVISFYHRFFPNVYKALELMPLDQIPSEKFSSEIQSSTQEWESFASKKKGTLADRQKEIQISRNANERLNSLIKNPKINVTLKSVVESIKKEQRVALTPLDELFWNSVIGRKAKSDLSSLKSSASEIRSVKINSEKGTLEYQLSDNEKDRYRIRVLEKGESVLRVKGEVSKVRAPSSELGKDSELKVFDLKGSFYQKKDDKLPFGIYPPPQDLYLSEDGVTHFKGDGHQHFF